MLKRFCYLSWIIGSLSFLLCACTGVDQGRSTALTNSQQAAFSPATNINQDPTHLALPSLTEPLGSSSDPAKPRDYKVGPDDLIEVTLFNVDQQKDGLPGKMEVRVSQTGFITLPLLDKIQVGGLTIADLEQSLRTKYGAYMYDPDVGVKVTQYRSQLVSVWGAVWKPGVYEMTAPRNLADLLATAGGVKPAEAGGFVHISRSGTEGQQTYIIDLRDLAANTNGEINVPIRSGDVITVPPAGSFFVDGYVVKPGAYPLLRQYTLTQALTVAGGIDVSSAKSSDITVFRRSTNGEIQTVKCDLSKIQALQAEDIQIAENDRIVVPPSMVKLVLTKVMRSIGFGIRSSAGFGGGLGGFGGGY